MTDTRVRGVIRAFQNTDKEPGDDKPAFSGKLTLPGDGRERAFALWARRDKHGAVILSGQANVGAGSAFDQIAALADADKDAPELKLGEGETPLLLKSRDIVLFENKKKGEKQPDFYGYHHTGVPERAPVQVVLWARTDTNGRAYLTGLTQEKAAQQQEELQEEEQDMEPVT